MIAEASRAAGVKRLIHFSALNADVNSPSRFLQSKVSLFLFSLIPRLSHPKLSLPPVFLITLSYLLVIRQEMMDVCSYLFVMKQLYTRLLSFTHVHRHLVRRWFVKHSQKQPSSARPIRLVLKTGSLTTMPDCEQSHLG